MICAAGGWPRCYKTGLAAWLCCHPEFFNTEKQQYHIKAGYGNTHVFKTPYPWNYLTKAQLKLKIREIHQKQIEDVLIFTDEVEDMFPNRDYNNPEQKKTLEGIGQHDKCGRIWIYTYQMGRPDDGLLGPDKILRANTQIEFEMRYFNASVPYADYILRSFITPDFEPVEGRLGPDDIDYSLWNTKEKVV